MKRQLLFLCLCALAMTVAALAPAIASAWAPVNQATVHPGVMTFTDGAQCTSNFVFTQGPNVYLGQAAHCSGTGDAVNADGCDSPSLPIGTSVRVAGASRPGKLVYNSWRTMQARRETNANACAYNDFALVRIDPADVGRVNPSVPGFGGPTGVGGVGGLGSTVYSYGNSSLRGGVTKLSPKQGVLARNTGGGWNHTVYTATAWDSRRLGQRLPERLRRRDRRAEHARDPALRGLERGRRPGEGARVHARQQLLLGGSAGAGDEALRPEPGRGDSPRLTSSCPPR